MKFSSFFPNSFFETMSDGLDNSSWKKKAFFIFLFALLAWGAAFSFWIDAEELRMRRSLQRARFNELVSVLREYSALKGAIDVTGTGSPLEAVPEGELLSVISDVVSDLGLRSNMVSLSTAAARGGQNAVSITLEGLSAESFAMFLQEMDRRGIVAFSADIRAVRVSDEKRTLTVFLLLGGAS